MFEEMTFSERLQRNLKLELCGMQKPSIYTDDLMGVKNNGIKNRYLQDCCYRYIEMRKENKVSEEVQKKIDRLKEEIRKRINFFIKDLGEDEDQFTREGTYKENYSKLRAKYYEILGWRSALETLSEKEFKPLDARKAIQTKVDDAKRWNDFLNNVGAKK